MLSRCKHNALSNKQITFVTWMLLCIVPITGMAIDLITPALPLISQNLKVSDSLAQILIGLYFSGYALGNFVTGIIINALFGRQIQMRVLLILFAIVSLLPIFFPNIIVLLSARLLQGLTLGGVSVLIRVILSDILSEKKLITSGVLVGTMWGIGPVIGPIIGSYLSDYFGWQSCFYFFSFLSLFYFVIVFCLLPETQPHTQEMDAKKIYADILEVVKHRKFMTLAIVQGLVYGAVITYHTAGAFLVEQQLNHTIIYFGKLGLLLGCVFLISSLISRYIAGKYQYEKIIITVIHLYIIFIFAAVIIDYYMPNNIIIIIVTTILMFGLFGNIFPLSIGKGLSLFKHISGTAAAMQYLINMTITGAISLIVSIIDIKQISSLIAIYGVIILLITLFYWLGIHHRKD